MQMKYLVAVLVLTGALAVPVATAAQHEGASLTVIAREGADCSGGASFCLEVEGSPELAPGDSVTVTYRNEGQAGHSLYIAAKEDADSSHTDTGESTGEAEIDVIEAGEEESTTFTVPEAEALYLWCDVTGHEAAGMWTEVELAEGNGSMDDPNGMDEPSSEAPVPGLVAVLALLAVSALARRSS